VGRGEKTRPANLRNAIVSEKKAVILLLAEAFKLNHSHCRMEGRVNFDVQTRYREKKKRRKKRWEAHHVNYKTTHAMVEKREFWFIGKGHCLAWEPWGEKKYKSRVF